MVDFHDAVWGGGSGDIKVNLPHKRSCEEAVGGEVLAPARSSCLADALELTCMHGPTCAAPTGQLTNDAGLEPLWRTLNFTG